MAGMDRDERGRFTPEHPDEDFIDAVESLELATTSDVAEAVGVTRQNADQRLRRLRNEERVDARMVGNSLVWTLAEGGT